MFNCDPDPNDACKNCIATECGNECNACAMDPECVECASCLQQNGDLGACPMCGFEGTEGDFLLCGANCQGVCQ